MKCCVCGKEISKSQFAHKPLCSVKCFEEDFWNENLDDKAIIIDGVCYHDGGRLNADQLMHTTFVGHGGRLFRMRSLTTGEVLETNNLWCNGDVPKERNVADTHEFVPIKSHLSIQGVDYTKEVKDHD